MKLSLARSQTRTVISDPTVNVSVAATKPAVSSRAVRVLTAAAPSAATSPSVEAPFTCALLSSCNFSSPADGSSPPPALALQQCIHPWKSPAAACATCPRKPKKKPPPKPRSNPETAQPERIQTVSAAL
ncbi:MAG: hypothetical protein WDW38_010921 [Sanguina aurantia]